MNEDEALEIIRDAMARNFESQVALGEKMINLKPLRDVEIRHAGQALHVPAGVFLAVLDDGKDGAVMQALTPEVGAEGQAGAREMRIRFRALRSPCTGKTLTPLELAAWSAANEYEEEGRPDDARELLAAVYGVRDAAPRVGQIKLVDAHNPISKPTKVLTREELFSDSLVRLDTSRSGAGKSFTRMRLWVDDPKAALSRPIDEYDKTVLAALATIGTEAPGRIFTVDTVCRAMGINKPKQSQKEAALESMRKMGSIMCEIDMGEEAPRRGLKRDVLRGHLIDFLEREAVAANGRTVNAIELLAEPITFRHARAMGQVATFPARYLAFGDGSNTETNLNLRRMVLERVAELKNGRGEGVSDHIRIARDPKAPGRPIEIEAAGVDVLDRDARKAACDFICSVLRDLRDEGEIKGYQVLDEKGRQARGRAVRAVVEIRAL